MFFSAKGAELISNLGHRPRISGFQRFAMIQFSNPWGVAPGSYEEGAVGANKRAAEATAISLS